MTHAVARPDWMTEDLLIFEDAVTKFTEKELLPHGAKWEAEGQVPRDIWRKAGAGVPLSGAFAGRCV